MPIEDFPNIEFGICQIIGGINVYNRIPVNIDVKKSLCEMYDSFYESYLRIEEEAVEFSPSEKYSGNEKLFYNIDNENVSELKSLFDNPNIQINEESFSETASDSHYYFGIFYHVNGQKLIGIKRPSQFKGLVKKQGKLMRWYDDTLQIIPDNVFKLDDDFDFILSAERIDILHPTGFIFISNIYDEILRSAVQTARELGQRIGFVNFSSIADLAGNSKTIAKLLSSLKSRDDLEQISQERLISKCQSVGIEITELGDQITPNQGREIDFLNVLDRRQYDYDLIENQTEIYRASSRTKI